MVYNIMFLPRWWLSHNISMRSTFEPHAMISPKLCFHKKWSFLGREICEIIRKGSLTFNVSQKGFIFKSCVLDSPWKGISNYLKNIHFAPPPQISIYWELTPCFSCKKVTNVHEQKGPTWGFEKGKCPLSIFKKIRFVICPFLRKSDLSFVHF